MSRQHRKRLCGTDEIDLCYAQPFLIACVLFNIWQYTLNNILDRISL